MSKAATRPRRRRGLRFRITATFALGGLFISAVLALVMYDIAERYLVRQRERTATRQAYLDARVVRDALRSEETDPNEALDSLQLPPSSSVVLERDGLWYGTSVAVARENLPEELRDLVLDGQPARQRVEIRGVPDLVVGVPIPEVDAGYFEVFSLEEVDSSLGVIRTTVMLGAAATTLMTAVLGFWVGRRTLRPVQEVSLAAATIAGGDLETRLDARGDPDLEPLAESFNSMVDALQERIQRDARFVSDVSHELRSPLTTLATAASVLQRRREELPERSRVSLDLLVAEIERFQRVVEELLELSRAEAGSDALDLQPVRLSDLVLHTVTRSDGSPPVIRIAPDIADTPLLTDKRRMERVLVNLLDNARTHGGGATAVAVVRANGQVRIAVDDDGPGIPARERTRVFQRFFRGAASGRRGTTSGTGLGLALVAEHARAMHGKAWVEDAPGGGARFILEVPWTPA
jgi:two-component system, OmpR family, sensor histidine kinase MtrB